MRSGNIIKGAIGLFLTVSIVVVLVEVADGNSNGAVFPNFPCSQWYDKRRQQTFPSALRYCQEGQRQRKILAKRRNITEIKGCILWRIRAITETDSGSFDYDDSGVKKSLLTIFGGLFTNEYTQQQNDERKAVVDEMLKKSAPCKEILNDVANRKKLKSVQWTPFYDCIDKAWNC